MINDMIDRVWYDPLARRLAVGGIIGLVAGYAVQHASWIISWSSVNGQQTYDLTQAHGVCTSPLGETAQMVFSGEATICSSVSGWWSFSNILFIAGGIALVLAAWRAYQAHQARQASPPGPVA